MRHLCSGPACYQVSVAVITLLTQAGTQDVFCPRLVGSLIYPLQSCNLLQCLIHLLSSVLFVLDLTAQCSSSVQGQLAFRLGLLLFVSLSKLLW